MDGELRQDGSTEDMIFGVNHLVWYLSQFTVLDPGDLVNTGTPAGVAFGANDFPYLRAGNVVGLEMDRLGRQRQCVGQA
jgi:2-keto-4-pentenoate hydratase/2-oxohepta-3-ene-1,7-dioic acid hydratase in catechol pathway